MIDAEGIKAYLAWRQGVAMLNEESGVAAYQEAMEAKEAVESVEIALRLIDPKINELEQLIEDNEDLEGEEQPWVNHVRTHLDTLSELRDILLVEGAEYIEERTIADSGTIRTRIR